MPASGPTAASLLAEARARLAAAGVDAPATDARVLLGHVLGWTAARVLAARDEPVPPAAAERFRTMVARRAAREPLAYLAERREFGGLELFVTPAVLIPRPETELLVSALLERLPPGAAAPTCGGSPVVWDAGTGSGAVAVAVAAARPDVRVVASDRSPAALSVCAGNARRHGVAGRVRPVLADWLEPAAAGSLDAVAANPPYVRTEELSRLPPEVRDHEPRAALDGGPDGLDAVRRVVAGALRALAPGGWLVVEIGAGQGRAALDLAKRGTRGGGSGGFDPVEVLPDLAGVPRVLAARRAG